MPYLCELGSTVTVIKSKCCVENQCETESEGVVTSRFQGLRSCAVSVIKILVTNKEMKIFFNLGVFFFNIHFFRT